MSENIFSNFYNKVLSFFQKERDENTESSKDAATNRLKLVLMQDRSNLDGATMQKMREQLIQVISKYVEIDQEALDLNLESDGDEIALMLNIPVLRARTREEIEELEKLEEKNEKEELNNEEVESESDDENTANEDNETSEDCETESDNEPSESKSEDESEETDNKTEDTEIKADEESEKAEQADEKPETADCEDKNDSSETKKAKKQKNK